TNWTGGSSRRWSRTGGPPTPRSGREWACPRRPSSAGWTGCAPPGRSPGSPPSWILASSAGPPQPTWSSSAGGGPHRRTSPPRPPAAGTGVPRGGAGRPRTPGGAAGCPPAGGAAAGLWDKVGALIGPGPFLARQKGVLVFPGWGGGVVFPRVAPPPRGAPPAG